MTRSFSKLRYQLMFASLCLIALNAFAVDPPLSFERDDVILQEGKVEPAAKPEERGRFPNKPGPGLVFRKIVRHEKGARIIRVGIEVVTVPTSDAWRVEISSVDDGRLLASVRKPGIETPEWRDDPAPPRSTTTLFSDSFPPQNAVVLKVFSDQTNAAPQMELASLTTETPPGKSQAIPDGNDQLEEFELQLRSEVKRWGSAVARLRWEGLDGKNYRCTGFLIAPDLLMTNYHCIQYTDEMDSAVADFDANSAGATIVTRTLTTLAKRNKALDVAIFRLSALMTAPPLRLSKDVMPANPNLFVIIQHPDGGFKKVSNINCRLEGLSMVGLDPAQKTDFGHMCDTHKGSSGSPVQDTTTGLVVGLHHLASQQNTLFNRAVHSDQILEFLRLNANAIFQSLVPQPVAP